MERRKSNVRRQEHLFVANERREGPYDRRGDKNRQQERIKEKEKIERIRAFKEKAGTPQAVTPTPSITKIRPLYVGLVVLAIVLVMWLLQ